MSILTVLAVDEVTKIAVAAVVAVVAVVGNAGVDVEGTSRWLSFSDVTEFEVNEVVVAGISVRLG